jgi:hypothetical protein
MFFAVNVRVYDLIYATQGFQQLILIIGLATISFFIIHKKRLTYAAKIWLCGLAIAWIIANLGIYIYGVHNYIQYERPLYEQENFSKTGV